MQWVTAHRDGELFSGGDYTNQSNGGARGIRSWVARNDTVEDSEWVDMMPICCISFLTSAWSYGTRSASPTTPAWKTSRS